MHNTLQIPTSKQRRDGWKAVQTEPKTKQGFFQKARAGKSVRACNLLQRRLYEGQDEEQQAKKAPVPEDY